MKLSDILKNTDFEKINFDNIEVKSIEIDSRLVASGSMYVAIKGENFDGNDFINDAVEKGAVAVVSETKVEGVKVPLLITKDIRGALALLSKNLYKDPSSTLDIAAVTGTNGKTTTSFLINSVLKEVDEYAGIMGTIAYGYGDRTIDAPFTTPESNFLNSFLKEMNDEGAKKAVMEISSHSLDNKRVEGLKFKARVFTNLTQEHMDYHHTMEDYYKAKAKLFNIEYEKEGCVTFVNMDDQWGEKLLEKNKNFISFGFTKEAQITPLDFTLNDSSTEAIIKTPDGDFKINSSLVGEYNLYNIMAAIGVGNAFNIEKEKIIKGIENLKNVPGRLEKIDCKKNLNVFVDYAHTPDALERAIKAVRKITKNKARVITVFGCGGDRDRIKRPIMGEASTSLSNVTIVTSDNPRTENSDSIIGDIERGIMGVPCLREGDDFEDNYYIVISDREKAIDCAMNMAKENDSILIAGKGHEDYQIIGTEKIHFDDREIARKYCN